VDISVKSDAPAREGLAVALAFKAELSQRTRQREKYQA